MSRAQQRVLDRPQAPAGLRTLPDQVSALFTGARGPGFDAADPRQSGSCEKPKVDSGEQALQSAVQLFDKVETLGTQGTRTSRRPRKKAEIAQQIDAVLKHWWASPARPWKGVSIFSGDSASRRLTPMTPRKAKSR